MSAHADSPNGQHENVKATEAESEPHPTSEPSIDTSAAPVQQKRKASSPTPTNEPSSNSPKRAKTEAERAGGRIGRDAKPAAEAGRDRREIARQEEKKRGRRLLGGLMNTLSQAGAGSQFKKRQDIERRQQAKSTSQRVEDDRLRVQRLAKLEAVRKVEQLKFEEKKMKTRHADMLAKARYLHTRARPKIYYLPWELTKKQEETIKHQIREVEQIIEREVSEFREYKEKRQASVGTAVKPPVPEKSSPPLSGIPEAVGKPNDEPPTDKAEPESTNRPPSRGTIKVGPDRVPDKDPDRAEDVMIEEAEDTVIY